MHVFPPFVVSLYFLTVTASAAARGNSSYLKLPFQKVRQNSTGPILESFPASPINKDGGSYVIDVTIGTPSQSMNLVLDTASADIWFYAPESVISCPSCTSSYYDYSNSTTGTMLASLREFNTAHGSSHGVTGFYASDLLSVSGVSVRQTIGVATAADLSNPPDGIMGIGIPFFESIVFRNGVVNTSATYPGYIDSLINAGIINTRAYSIFLNDRTPTDITPGTIIFGGYDTTKYSGDLVPFQLIDYDPYNGYSLDIAAPAMDFVHDGKNYTVPSSSVYHTITLDPGTAISLIPADQFTAINDVLALTESTTEPFYTVPCDVATWSGSFDFTISGSQGQMTLQVPWAELVLSLDDGTCAFGLAPQRTTVLVTVLGETVLGETILRSAYLLYNYDNGTVSIAQVKYDQSDGHIISL